MFKIFIIFIYENENIQNLIKMSMKIIILIIIITLIIICMLKLIFSFTN